MEQCLCSLKVPVNHHLNEAENERGGRSMQNRRRPVVFLLGQQMRKSAFDFRVIAGLNRPKWFSSSLKSP